MVGLSGVLGLVLMFLGLALSLTIGLYPNAQWGMGETVSLSLGGTLFFVGLLLRLKNSTHKHT